MDWSQAQAFCKWIGGRLPTAQEREWAVSGGEERHYPWGDDSPGEARACWNGDGNDLGRDNRRTTCRVGAYPAGASKHGLLDLAGNVEEWTSTDKSSSDKAVRGGSWRSSVVPEQLGLWGNDGRSPSSGYDGLGFRCGL